MGNRHARTGSWSLVCVLAALLGCDESKRTSTAQPLGVETSYHELAGEFAACGEHLQSCLTQADADGAGRWACREEFGECRAEAGKHAVQTMVVAIHACVDRAKQCKRGSDAGSHECRSELWACLWRGRQPEREADAGSDEHDGAHGRDCIEKLRRAVWAGRDAGSCAREVRECVADALPRAEELVSDAETPGTGPAANGSTASAGRGRQRPTTCLLDFRGCVRERRDSRACVESLRECAHPRR